MALCVMHMSLWNTFKAAKVYYNYSRFKHILCGVLLAVCLISSSHNHYNHTRTNQQSAASRLDHPDIFSRAAQLLHKKIQGWAFWETQPRSVLIHGKDPTLKNNSFEKRTEDSLSSERVGD